MPPELGDDPRIALRRTLGMFATGVTVITTREGEKVHGMTANAFMSVSLEPPLVLISVDRRTKMCGLLHEGRTYGVSVLCEAQSALSDRFAGRAGATRPEPRFEIVHDTPLVEGALAHFVAERHPLLLGRGPLAVPRPRRVRALLRGHAAAVPRRPLRAARRRTSDPRLGPRALLLRVVEREPHDGRRDPLLVPVELADLDLRAGLGVLDGHAAQRDVLAQRRASACPT